MIEVYVQYEVHCAYCEDAEIIGKGDVTYSRTTATLAKHLRSIGWQLGKDANMCPKHTFKNIEETS